MSKVSSIFGGGVDSGADDARRREEERRQRIAEGTSRVNSIFDAQFSPNFFQERFQSAMNFWLPQLQSQFTDAQRDLTLALSRAGQLNSSTRGQRFAELGEKFELQRQALVDRARGQVNQEKADIERARSGLISQLSSTGDAAGAAQQALNQARVLSEPASFDPLEQLFVDVTSGIASVADVERRNRQQIGARVFASSPSQSSGIVRGS